MTYEMTEREIEVEGIMHATSDAYSFDRYTEAGWRECIALLMDEYGADRPRVEAFLMSKHMRWAGDMEPRDDVEHGDYDGETLRSYLAKWPEYASPAALTDLLEG